MEQKLSKEAQQQLVELRQWINSQPHFPKNIDDKLVIRFLHSNYYNLEKAKTTAEMFFNLRASATDILTNRDPHSANVQRTLKIVNLAQYPIPGNKNLWIWQLNDPGLEVYDYLEDAKLFFLSTDSWLLNNEDLEEEDIAVLDVKDISIKFLTKFNVSIAKKLSKYQEDAMPIRLKAVHIINSPPIIDKLFGLMKPFMNKDMTGMIHFHTPKSTTLYDYISKEDLPSDFGGSRNSMAEYMEETTKVLMSKRDFFLDDTNWKSIKKDKNSTNKTEKQTVDTGSFRTLAID